MQMLSTISLVIDMFCCFNVGDGPTLVNINFFLRSISKIDDYKMVSSRWASASHVKYWVCTVSVVRIARVRA